MTRLSLLLALAVAGCHVPSQEVQIAHCHTNGYSARTYQKSRYVNCCSVLNGDRVCLRASDVTKHRREAGQ